jgi:transcriptional regulator with XRE-family HTH domain
MCTQLHERLKQARNRRGLSLAAIAQKWGVREQNLVLIEQNAFEELPTGLYGRNAVRSYATAVGIPAEEALAEVANRLRLPEDPLDGLARVRGLTRPPARPAAFESLRPVAIAWRPHAAAALDAVLLLGLDFVLLQLTAIVAGVGISDVMRVGAPSIVLFFTLIAALYFTLRHQGSTVLRVRRVYGAQVLRVIQIPQALSVKMSR